MNAFDLIEKIKPLVADLTSEELIDFIDNYMKPQAYPGGYLTKTKLNLTTEQMAANRNRKFNNF